MQLYKKTVTKVKSKLKDEKYFNTYYRKTVTFHNIQRLYKSIKDKKKLYRKNGKVFNSNFSGKKIQIACKTLKFCLI